MMNDQLVKEIVARVIGRVAMQVGANGSRGTIVAIFSGATVGLTEGFHQIRLLLLDGFRVKLILSDAAADLYGPLLMSQLDGFPHWQLLEADNWFAALTQSQAVIVPSLSINTLSKLSLLIADNLVTNLTMHSLLLNKPLILARNGADPDKRRQAGMGAEQTPALKQAIHERMQTIESYGARLVDVMHLRDTINSCLDSQGKKSVKTSTQKRLPTNRAVISVQGRMVTAGHVRKAHQMDADLKLAPGVMTTPLAMDLASQYGVNLISM